MSSTFTDNTSGQGANAVVPPEIRGWNWGAFLLTWIWGIGNNVLIALLALVPFVGIVMCFMLGVKGNEWAWQQKRWDNVEHFKRVQRMWTKWAVIVFLAIVVVTVVFVALIFFLVTTLMKNSEPYRTGLDRVFADSALMAELGEPISPGFPMGSINSNDDEGSVDLRIRIRGAKKSGVLYVEGEKSEGQWHYTRIDFVIDGQHIDLDDKKDGAP